MDKNEIEKQILERTKAVDKTYSFKNDHNPRLLTDFWFQDSIEGLTLFVVFYTQTCRWAQCLSCNLPSLGSQKHVPFKFIMRQVELLFDFILSKKEKLSLKKIIISNNGSVLDEETFPTSALIYFIAKMNIHCPNVSVLTIETRPEYVDLAELEVLARALKEGDTQTQLELAVGFEAFDEVIRNEHFKKGLSLNSFEKMVKRIAKYGYDLKVYFMFKPVAALSEEEAIEDIKRGINYLSDIAKSYNIKINLHLNPTYVAYGTPLEKEFNRGNYTPPQLESIRKAVLAAKGKQISVFVGLYDEGLAVSGGSFIRKGDDKLVKLLSQFNVTQDYKLLRKR